MRLAALAAAAVLGAAFSLPAFAETKPVTPAPTPAAPLPADPYTWLEEMQGKRALAWVNRENARSLAVLKGDPRYEPLHQDALKIVNATDRIAYPSLIGRAVFNFWQDPVNVRGLWRRTTQADYATAAPNWETVLDIDALSKTEKANWVWKGANCPPPNYDRCLVSLSDGGEDATDDPEHGEGHRADCGPAPCQPTDGKCEQSDHHDHAGAKGGLVSGAEGRHRPVLQPLRRVVDELGTDCVER